MNNCLRATAATGSTVARRWPVRALTLATIIAFGVSITAPQVRPVGATVLRPTGSPTVITTCSWGALAPALTAGGHIEFQCSGTIGIESTIVVAGGAKLILDGSIGNVTFDPGTTPTSLNGRMFEVRSGGSLTLLHVAVVGGSRTGASGVAGVNGVDGATGTFAGAGTGARGGNGGNGTAGHERDGRAAGNRWRDDDRRRCKRPN